MRHACLYREAPIDVAAWRTAIAAYPKPCWLFWYGCVLHVTRVCTHRGYGAQSGSRALLVQHNSCATATATMGIPARRRCNPNSEPCQLASQQWSTCLASVASPSPVAP